MKPEDALRHAVKKKRRADHLSLRELGALLDVSFSSIARLERGEGAGNCLTRRLLLAWVHGEEINDVLRPRKHLAPSILRSEIEAIVDTRMRAWAQWLGTDRRLRSVHEPTFSEEPLPCPAP